MTDGNSASVLGAWTPHTSYDLLNGDGISFANVIAKFRAWAKTQERQPLTLTTGWHTLRGPTIEQLLIRNTHNRAVRYGTVLMYATSMVNRRWQKTGQPIIITDKGDTEDGQNRLFAAYFTGVPLETFVVTDVPAQKNLFAFIDNGQARTGEDALTIAGLNGLSKHIAQVIKEYAIRYDENLLLYAGRGPISPITNVDILDYAQAHPDLSDAAHTMRDVYPQAASRIGDSKVATFVGWKILQHHGSDTLEQFAAAMVSEDLPATHPVMVLRKRIEAHEQAKFAPPRSDKHKLQLTPTKILALTTKAFNLMQQGASVRRLDPRADDPFPRFEDLTEAEAAPTAEAAQ